MRENIQGLQTQLYPLPAEALWSLSANERSHIFVHKSSDPLLLRFDYDCGPSFPVQLSEISMALNLILHLTNTPPHDYGFGTMSRVSVEASTTRRLPDRQYRRTIAQNGSSQ